MDALGLLTGALLALVVALLLFRERPAPREPEPGQGAGAERLDVILARISGDPIRDRPLLNRALALGPTVVPNVIEALSEALRDPDGAPPARVARLEELIADFGLAAVGPVCDQLGRLKPTVPLSASLTRIIARLGQPGVQATFARAIAQPGLAPFLPRLQAAARDPGAALTGALAQRPTVARRIALDTMAGLLVDHPEVVDDLWLAWDPPGRADLVRWLADWPPLARQAHAARALADPADGVCAAGARLARLFADPALSPALQAAAGAGRSVEARCAALAALEADPQATETLRAALGAPEPEVAFAAALAWCGRADFDPQVAAPALPAPHQAVLAGRPEAALAALDHADGTVRLLAVARATAALPQDPRARERLIRLADGGPAGSDRQAAILALARAGDPTAPDLVVKGLRDDPDDEGLAWLQLAAAALGERAVGPLARRLRVEPVRRAPAFLTVLRAVPLGGAVPPLLRGLEDARSGALEGAMAATVHAGGPEVRAAVDQCLHQPDRGLLAPGLRFLAVHATAADLPTLMALHDRHPPLRGIILNIVEGVGAPAIPALEARILAGGDDEPLARLEARLALLQACAAEGAA